MLAGEAGSKLKVLTWRHISLLPSQAHVFVLVSLIPFSTHLHPRMSHTELTFALRARNLTVILFSMWTILSFLWGIVTKYSSVWNQASDFPPPGWTGLWAASFTVAVSQPQNDLNWKSDTANRRSVSLKGFCKQQGSRWLPTGWTIHLLPTCGCICRSCSWKTS